MALFYASNDAWKEIENSANSKSVWHLAVLIYSLKNYFSAKNLPEIYGYGFVFVTSPYDN